MKKIVTLTENDIAKLVQEAVQEISLKTLKSVDREGILASLDKTKEAARIIDNELRYFGKGYANPKSNNMYTAALNGIEAVKAYLNYKAEQVGYLDDVAGSASYMRNDDNDGPITRDEYADADRMTANRNLNKTI